MHASGHLVQQQANTAEATPSQVLLLLLSSDKANRTASGKYLLKEDIEYEGPALGTVKGTLK
jgi:hypothetical protein